MHGIIGSGFGLYGYLPAMLLHQSGPVLLAERSRPRLVGRPELAWTLPRIAWARDSRELLERASVLAIAIPPVAQQILLEESPGLCARALLLEKPIA